MLFNIILVAVGYFYLSHFCHLYSPFRAASLFFNKNYGHWASFWWKFSRGTSFQCVRGADKRLAYSEIQFKTCLRGQVARKMASRLTAFRYSRALFFFVFWSTEFNIAGQRLKFLLKYIAFISLFVSGFSTTRLISHFVRIEQRQVLVYSFNKRNRNYP